MIRSLMPKGDNLTSTHQRHAASRPRPSKVPASVQAGPDETLDEAVLRFQQAKADTEGLDAEKRAIDIARMRADLIPAADAREEIEATHQRWVEEFQSLPQVVASLIPPEVPASVREQIRALVETACLAARARIGSK